MPEQKPTRAERPILEDLEKLRLKNARSSLLQTLGMRRRQMESLALAREMSLPACSLVVMSYDAGKPKFLLLFKARGGRALGPSGCVEGGEEPLESLCRISNSQLGLGAAGMKAVSECYVPGCNGRESHLFVLHIPLQKLRDIAGEVNSGKRPDFVLGCVAGADQLLGEGPDLDATHLRFAQSIATAEKMTA